MLFGRMHGLHASRAGVLQEVDEHEMPEAMTGSRRGSHKSGSLPGKGAQSPPASKPMRPRGVLKTDWDPDLLRDALETAGGYIPEAARLLGLSRSHAYRLYKELNAYGQSPGTERSSHDSRRPESGSN
jgi:transcriptional regulator of acetoin/glycerol metabolism